MCWVVHLTAQHGLWIAANRPVYPELAAGAAGLRARSVAPCDQIRACDGRLRPRLSRYARQGQLRGRPAGGSGTKRLPARVLLVALRWAAAPVGPLSAAQWWHTSTAKPTSTIASVTADLKKRCEGPARWRCPTRGGAAERGTASGSTTAPWPPGRTLALRPTEVPALGPATRRTRRPEARAGTRPPCVLRDLREREPANFPRAAGSYPAPPGADGHHQRTDARRAAPIAFAVLALVLPSRRSRVRSTSRSKTTSNGAVSGTFLPPYVPD